MTLNHDEMSVLSGQSPVAAPFTLLICQIVIIIIVGRVCGELAKFAKQPEVVGEIFAGLLMGPSILGNIEWWGTTIFPLKSLPNLRLFSEFGLVFFMFMVGLELDLSLVKSNFKAATIVSTACIIIPLLSGMSIAPLYWHIIESDPTLSVTYWPFILFVGVAMSVTAFPIQQRIISQMGMTLDPVAIIVLSAAALDDVVAWCLLALVTALVTASNPVTFVWVCLSSTAFVVFSIFVLRPLLERAIKWHFNHGGALSLNLVAATCVFALLSAWVTRAFGINAIFGAFVTGVSIPRHDKFSFQVMKRIEDFGLAVLLPLYFAFTGLRTQINSINSAEAVGLTVLACFVASLSKFLPGVGTARWLGFPWRESVSIGTMMNCKALIELIALNAGLDAGAINSSFYSMFVVMALWTTVVTFPVVSWVYPLDYRQARDAKDAVGGVNDAKRRATLSVSELNRLRETKLHVVLPVASTGDAESAVSFLATIHPLQQHTESNVKELFTVTLHRPNDNYNHSTNTTCTNTGKCGRDDVLSVFYAKCQSFNIDTSTYNSTPCGKATAVQITPTPDLFISPWTETTHPLLHLDPHLTHTDTAVFVPASNPPPMNTTAINTNRNVIVGLYFGGRDEQNTIALALQLAKISGAECRIISCIPKGASTAEKDPETNIAQMKPEKDPRSPAVEQHSIDLDSQDTFPLGDLTPCTTDLFFANLLSFAAQEHTNTSVSCTEISMFGDAMTALMNDATGRVRLVVYTEEIPLWALQSLSGMGGVEKGDTWENLGPVGGVLHGSNVSFPLLCVSKPSGRRECDANMTQKGVV